MCDKNFINLNLNFEKWLQYADLNAQLDNIYDSENEINHKRKVEYENKLSELSSNLLKNYPFEINRNKKTTHNMSLTICDRRKNIGSTKYHY